MRTALPISRGKRFILSWKQTAKLSICKFTEVTQDTLWFHWGLSVRPGGRVQRMRTCRWILLLVLSGLLTNTPYICTCCFTPCVLALLCHGTILQFQIAWLTCEDIRLMLRNYEPGKLCLRLRSSITAWADYAYAYADRSDSSERPLVQDLRRVGLT